MKYFFSLVLAAFATSAAFSQGPPITADKPIMLGGGYIIKTLTEVRSTDGGTFTRIPLMIHHLPSASSLVAAHIPIVHHRFAEGSEHQNGTNWGDIQLLGKYQFYRKDGHARTFRMVLKTIQNLPTGKPYGIEGISTGTYQSYFGIVAGRETIKLGLSGEVGYNIAPSSDFDELRIRLGAGLPVLKPVYPVKQLNFYFELSHNTLVNLDRSELLYAQGIQFAIRRLTFEFAYQWALSDNDALYALKNSLYFGTRYII